MKTIANYAAEAEAWLAERPYSQVTEGDAAAATAAAAVKAGEIIPRNRGFLAARITAALGAARAASLARQTAEAEATCPVPAEVPVHLYRAARTELEAAGWGSSAHRLAIFRAGRAACAAAIQEGNVSLARQLALISPVPGTPEANNSVGQAIANSVAAAELAKFSGQKTIKKVGEWVEHGLHGGDYAQWELDSQEWTDAKTAAAEKQKKVAEILGVNL